MTRLLREVRAAQGPLFFLQNRALDSSILAMLRKSEKGFAVKIMYECDNSLVAVLAYSLRAKMVVGSNRSMDDIEQGVLCFVLDILASVEYRVWPHILHTTLIGVVRRTSDMSAVGKVVGTLLRLDPEQTMPHDKIRQCCLSGDHDKLNQLLEDQDLSGRIAH